MKPNRTRYGFAVFQLLLFIPLWTFAQSNLPLQQKIAQITGPSHVRIQGQQVQVNPTFVQIYSETGYRPLWHSVDALNSLLQVVAASKDDGLSPETYHYSALARLIKKVDLSNDEDWVRLDLDILATDSLIQLSRHLRVGKVDPKILEPDWNYSSDASKQTQTIPFAQWIASGEIEKNVAKLAPSHLVYGAMKQNLKRYRHLAERGGWKPIGDGPTLRKGDQDVRVIALRARLIAEGAQLSSAASPQFDEELRQEVFKAQKRYFLQADGLVGKGTRRALNVPVEARVDQIRVNLERMRWVMHDLKRRFLLIDIAGFDAWYFENGKRVWSARVQVGRTYRKTPVFQDEIRFLEFNPTWTAPPTIIEEDLWPKLQKDPQYLSKHNMVLIDNQGNLVDAHTVDFRRYSGKNFPYMVRQLPGDENALGQVKFMFPNEHHIYLHDTPSKTLFNSSERAFSSGCIRIERPFELVDILLKDNVRGPFPGYQEILQSKITTRVNLKTPVPILLLYWTSRVDDAGAIQFKEDIYGRDIALLQRLNGI